MYSSVSSLLLVDPKMIVIQVIPTMMTHHQEDTEGIETTRDQKEGKINLRQTIQVTQVTTIKLQ